MFFQADRKSWASAVEKNGPAGCLSLLTDAVIGVLVAFNWLCSEIRCDRGNGCSSTVDSVVASSNSASSAAAGFGVLASNSSLLVITWISFFMMFSPSAYIRAGRVDPQIKFDSEASLVVGPLCSHGLVRVLVQFDVRPGSSQPRWDDRRKCPLPVVQNRPPDNLQQTLRFRLSGLLPPGFHSDHQ